MFRSLILLATLWTGTYAHGTDLDGAFGKEQCPTDLDTIADLQKVPEMLRARGYKDDDIENIMHLNFINFLINTWG